MSTASPAPFPHWMLREIHEQPTTLAATLAHYVQGGQFHPANCADIREWFAAVEGEIVIAASGSSRHAGLVAELLIEDLGGIAVDVEYASEYCYRSEKSLKNAAVIVISQSGETADTLAALRKAQTAGHQTLAVTNVPGSSMAVEASVSFPTLAGVERAIPATKSFTAQLLVLHLIALLAAESRNALDAATIEKYLQHLTRLASVLDLQMAIWESQVSQVARQYQSFKNFLFLGRGVHYAIAREGALKLKESSYLHAEGYPGGELKHGPNALVSDGTPLVMVATVDRSDPDAILRYEKILQLMRDMKAQGANIIAIANEGDHDIAALANVTVPVPELPESILPIAEVIPLQMLSYFMAINNDIDVDHPRNLTKAVVQE
jgi:glucosamine--fructose-6-phosphate aminotransferase (isomerizing)